MIQDFIANIYELWGSATLYGKDGFVFSDDMYNENIYWPVFLCMVISIVIVSITYYYILNHPRLTRWYHWIVFNLATSLLNFAIGWGISYGNLYDLYHAQNMSLPYSSMTEFFPFAGICFFWTFVLFFVCSMIIKWGSKNCKHSPIL